MALIVTLGIKNPLRDRIESLILWKNLMPGNPHVEVVLDPGRKKGESVLRNTFVNPEKVIEGDEAVFAELKRIYALAKVEMDLTSKLSPRTTELG